MVYKIIVILKVMVIEDIDVLVFCTNSIIIAKQNIGQEHRQNDLPLVSCSSLSVALTVNFSRISPCFASSL